MQTKMGYGVDEVKKKWCEIIHFRAIPARPEKSGKSG